MYKNLTELLNDPNEQTELVCGKTKQELNKTIKWIKKSPVYGRV